MDLSLAKPSNQIGDIGNKPYWFSLDGLVDELKVCNRAVPEKTIVANYKGHTPVPDSGLERRLMPRGPEELPDNFAAYHTKLKYYDEWDALWPVADDPDIVVTFKDTPVRMIFWRGTRYSPAWVTDKDQWMCDQSVEAWNQEEGCFEHMQDRHCRYSHVRLLEDTPARKVVHWRYAPVSAFNNLWKEDEKSGWAVWVDEYYYIYPDATAIRNVSWKAGALGQPRQFQESLPLTNPEQLRGDVMETDYLAVANLAGDVERFKYVEDPNKGSKDIPDSPNIQQHNFKSPYDPFIILEPGNKMQYLGDRDIDLLGRPGNCNHWPVAQAYCDGRLSQAADRPAHFLGFPISDPVIHREGDRNHLHSLYGMKDVSINRLVEMGRSWADAPALKIASDSDFDDGAYDMGQKAYLIDGNAAGEDDALEFEIEASQDSPSLNPAVVVEGWDGDGGDVVVDGRKLKDKDYEIGSVSEIDGVKTILWLKIDKRAPFTMRLGS